MKQKINSRNSLRSFLPLVSILVMIGLVCSVDGFSYTTYYAGDYNVLNGTYVSGSCPLSVTVVDNEYFILNSIGTDTSVNKYNTNGYTLLGSTSQASGSISNLTADDGVYMVFNSYSSGSDIEDYVNNDTHDKDGSADKGTHSNFTAQQYGPDLVNDTLTEENTGGNYTLWLYVNADDESRTEWTRIGTSPYLDAIDYSTNYVNASGNNLSVGDFNFTDSGKSLETISNVEVQLYAKQSGTNNNLEIFVWDGSEWTSAGNLATLTSWSWMNWTATTVLDTWTKIDSTKIYIKSSSGGGTYEVDCARLKVDYAPQNYELDLEAQWTNVEHSELNEELCIYGGTMSAENIGIDVWNGSDWENLFIDLKSGWNNASVTLYLTSSNFTIRFKGGNEMGDIIQNTWDIDAVLLHVWTDHYAAEVEFAGSSNIYNWKQLNLTFDSAWTTDTVNVTIQLYNYTALDYPTSGNGVISYTSSSIADTDETIHQMITTNSHHFRDNTGDWKIKVKAVKTTTTQFSFKVDWIMFGPTHWSEYTISTEFFFSNATAETPTQLNFTIVSQYILASVNVTIQVWNYSASAYATSGEACFTYTSNGTNETKLLSLNINPQYYISNGNAKIKITSFSATTQYKQEVNQVELGISTQTSIQPLIWFTPFLYVLPFVFGLLFLLALKLKRRNTKTSPKATESPKNSIHERKPREPQIVANEDLFSQQFETTHEQIKGKKMLLEIDHTTDSNKDMLNFISEAKNNDETLFILTKKNSVLHSTVSGDPDVKFLLLTSETPSPSQINEKETLLPANDISILLDYFASISRKKTEKTVNLIFDNLSDIILRCGRKKTYKFIPRLLETISSPNFTALFVFNPTVHDKHVQARIRDMLHKEAA